MSEPILAKVEMASFTVRVRAGTAFDAKGGMPGIHLVADETGSIALFIPDSRVDAIIAAIIRERDAMRFGARKPMPKDETL